MSNKLISEFGICNNKSIGGESIFQNILNVNCLKFHKETFKLLNKLMYNNLKPKNQNPLGAESFYLSHSRFFPKFT